MTELDINFQAEAIDYIKFAGHKFFCWIGLLV